MRIVEARSSADVASCVAELVRSRAPENVGVATGSSPVAAYRVIAANTILPPTARLYLLDEYIGLPIDDARRYRHVITSQLADPLGIPPTSVLGPDVDDPDLDGAARRYEQTLEAIGGVDLQICGIGRNGHLAFNEPGARFDSVTRVVTLSESTRRDNARFFLDVNEVPERAITQGMSTIGMAHCVVLIATGPSKAAALAATLEGPITPEVPASVLRLHDDVIVVADAPALSSLQRIPRVMESST